MKRTIYTGALALLVLLLITSGCRFMRGTRESSPSTGGGAGGGSGSGTSGPASIVLSESTTGFSAWGGIQRSADHVHLSDPAGILSQNFDLEGNTYTGAVGLNPSEVIPFP